MKIFKISLISKLFILLTLTSCHHNPVNTKLSKGWIPLTAHQYKKALNKKTDHHKEYSGLHMSFQASLVFLDSKIQSNQLKMKSQYKNWAENEASKQKQKLQEKLNTHSEFFLSFYSPNTKRNKLDQKASDWRIILKTSSKEIEGKIKFTDNISNHNSIFYPNLEPWGKFYSVTFPVSTAELESTKLDVVLMGPEGMASFNF